jgi:hypothetical protein
MVIHYQHLYEPETYMKHSFSKYRLLLFLVASILTIFIVRTALAARGNPPRLNDLFTAITLAGSLGVLLTKYRSLQKSDWIAAITLGGVVGAGMVFATLFLPYPFFEIVRGNSGQAVVRGLSATLAMLGGLVITRRGGPVQVRAANVEWRKAGTSLVLGLGIGVPLAVMNVFALQLTQGKSIIWQSPLAAIIDALQPGIVEEVIYRFALLGLLWLALHKTIPQHAAWLAGLLALLVHSFMHFDDLFLQAPLVALGMGLAMAVIWGLPLTILVLRRDLESAIAFHWIQDLARFITGF